MIHVGAYLGMDVLVKGAIDSVRGSTCHEIAEKLGLPKNVVGKALGRLHGRGEIVHLKAKRDGEYLVSASREERGHGTLSE